MILVGMPPPHKTLEASGWCGMVSIKVQFQINIELVPPYSYTCSDAHRQLAEYSHF